MKKHKIFADNPAGVPSRFVKIASKAVEAVFKDRNVSLPCRVELIFCGKDEMRALNLEKRGIDAVTDVLSFPMLELRPGEDVENAAMLDDFVGKRLDLGSIMICADRAFEQAAEFGHSPEREFAFLAAHSALHLLGYDHEDKDNGEMFDLQEKILSAIGLSREE